MGVVTAKTLVVTVSSDPQDVERAEGACIMYPEKRAPNQSKLQWQPAVHKPANLSKSTPS